MVPAFQEPKKSHEVDVCTWMLFLPVTKIIPKNPIEPQNTNFPGCMFFVVVFFPGGWCFVVSVCLCCFVHPLFSFLLGRKTENRKRFFHGSLILSYLILFSLIISDAADTINVMSYLLGS